MYYQLNHSKEYTNIYPYCKGFKQCYIEIHDNGKQIVSDYGVISKLDVKIDRHTLDNKQIQDLLKRYFYEPII